MLKTGDLLRQGRTQELWNMCCGHLRMSLDEFMDVQHRLMADQLRRLNDSELGRKLFKGNRPETVDEFRRAVPLTTYSDYCPELAERRVAALPGEPVAWAHSSGKTGDYSFKWVPYTEEFSRALGVVSYGAGMVASGTEWGDFDIPQVPKIIYAVAPRPYFTGALADFLRWQTDVRYIPPLEEAEAMDFEERIKLGFSQSLDSGFDFFFGLSLVLATIGDKFQESGRSTPLLPLLKRPRALARLVRGLLRSKLAGRPLMPRDLWKVKGILSGGLDSSVYRDRIKAQWGRYPLDIYACTEGGIIAMQAWDYGAMSFIPNLNLLEFVPEDEVLKYQMDASYSPKSVLLDGVDPGRNYEMIITNFHGGSMVRYRVGDMVSIASLRNDAAGIELPQMTFDRRVDDIIDLVFVRLSEKIIWQAVEAAGVPYKDWIAYKTPGEPDLNVLLEPLDVTPRTEQETAHAIFRQIIQTDDGAQTLIPEEYARMMNFNVRVTYLPRGTFDNYLHRRQAEGADLAHLKPPHVNPSEKDMAALLAGTDRR